MHANTNANTKKANKIDLKWIQWFIGLADAGFHFLRDNSTWLKSSNIDLNDPLFIALVKPWPWFP